MRPARAKNAPLVARRVAAALLYAHRRWCSSHQSAASARASSAQSARSLSSAASVRVTHATPRTAA